MTVRLMSRDPNNPTSYTIDTGYTFDGSRITVSAVGSYSYQLKMFFDQSDNVESITYNTDGNSPGYYDNSGNWYTLSSTSGTINVSDLTDFDYSKGISFGRSFSGSYTTSQPAATPVPKIGSNDISKIYLGSEEISKIYLGTEIVYEASVGPIEQIMSIPQMTSNSQDGFSVVANHYDRQWGSYEYTLFSPVSSGWFAGSNTSKPDTIRITFPEFHYISKIVLKQNSNSNSITHNGRVEVTIDGSTYTTLTSFTMDTTLDSLTTVDLNVSCLGYRLVFTDNASTQYPYNGVALGAVTTYEIISQGGSEQPWQQPVLTSDTTSYGTLTGNYFSPFYLHNISDGVDDDKDYCWAASSGNSGYLNWLLPVTLRITGIQVSWRSGDRPNGNVSIYTNSGKTTQIGNTTSHDSTHKLVQVQNIPSEGIVTNNLYIEISSSEDYPGIDEIYITATVVNLA